MIPTLLWHKQHGMRQFDADAEDMQKLHKEGWRDTPNHLDFSAPEVPEVLGQSSASATDTKTSQDSSPAEAAPKATTAAKATGRGKKS